MNNGNNSKKTGIELLKYVQVLYQNRAISKDEKNCISLFIREGMEQNSFDKLNQELYRILETTNIPQVVEEMILLQQ